MSSDIKARIEAAVKQILAASPRLSLPDLLDHDRVAFAYDDLPEDEVERQVRAALQAASRTRPAPARQSAAAPLPPAPAEYTFPKPPFRFAALNQTVYLPGEHAPRLDTPYADGLSAMLKVTWRIETPLLVGETRNGVVQPVSLSEGGEDWVIPGATLRGMIRAAMEAVSMARLRPFNDHHRYGMRDFKHPRYENVAKDPQAGWLQKTDTGWEITPADHAPVQIMALQGFTSGKAREQTPADFLKSWLDMDRKAKYSAIGQLGRRGPFDFDTAPPRDFPTDRRGQAGWLVVSGKALPRSNKVKETVFYNKPGASAAPLSTKAWHRFLLLHTRPGHSADIEQRDPDGAWADIKPHAEQGMRIPVFYVGDLENNESPDFFFGLTRLLKAPHAFGLGHRLPPAHRLEAAGEQAGLNPDFTEALFGYVYEPSDFGLEKKALSTRDPGKFARRSRIRFGFAKADKPDSLTPGNTLPRIQGAPRASFAPFYLDGEKDHSAGDGGQPGDAWKAAALAGRKRYLPRYPGPGAMGEAEAGLAESAAASIQAYRNQAQGREPGDQIVTRLQFLRPKRDADEMTFTGDIRLTNVRPAELGALLWVLTLGQGWTGDPVTRRHMLGRAPLWRRPERCCAHRGTHPPQYRPARRSGAHRPRAFPRRRAG